MEHLPKDKLPIATFSSQRPFSEPGETPMRPGPQIARVPEMEGRPTTPRPQIRGSELTQASLDERDAMDPDAAAVHVARDNAPIYASYGSLVLCLIFELALLASVVFLKSDRWLLIILLFVCSYIKSLLGGRPLLKALGLRNTGRYLIIFGIPVVGAVAMFRLYRDSYKIIN